MKVKCEVTAADMGQDISNSGTGSLLPGTQLGLWLGLGIM